ncbi:hypothetical protein [Paraburkholderia hospita]|uniref:hypothetical protein n=1 Tax=Paraburkholderia hospita TaxID=169430 RepID=UPI001A996508|nr:hypothetical protein [Paraburkholderia hospita]
MRRLHVLYPFIDSHLGGGPEFDTLLDAIIVASENILRRSQQSTPVVSDADHTVSAT